MNRRTKAVLLIGAGGALASGIHWLGVSRNQAVAPTVAKRDAAYGAAMEAGAKAPDWPGTPEALIEAFWLSASRKDYERLTVLCPGSTAEEYRGYYDRWTPSPAQSIGPPEPHPLDAEVQVFPVKVVFPGFPGKTI